MEMRWVALEAKSHWLPVCNSVIDVHCDKSWHFVVFTSEEQLETRMDDSGTQWD